jgi:predicted small metal-binding protein
MKITNRVELLKLLDHFELPRVVAEIGVAEGRFSKELYDAGVDALYLVDIWENVPFIEGCGSFDQSWHNANYESVKELFKYKTDVSLLKGFSHKMAELIPDGSLSLVYIDGDHTYNGCKADIKVWLPKLCAGGVLAFHDYANPTYGVKRAVIEHVQHEHLVNIIEEDSKLENIGAWIRK